MGRLLTISYNFLLNIPFLDIFSGLVDSFQKATNSGDYDPAKLKAAAKALQQIQPYLHFDNAINQIFSYLKWGVIKFIYGIANAASELATQSLNFSSLLDSNKLDPLVKNGVMLVVGGLMTVTLIIAAIKYGTDYHAPKLKNVFMQLLISAFLIFNIQPMMQTLVDFSTGAYKGFTQANNSKGTSGLPYKLVKNNSNDLFVLVSNNFKGLKKDKHGNVVQQKAVHYGSWNMSQNDFNKSSAGNLSTVITPDVAKDMSSKKNEKQWAWNPDNLRYMLEPSGANSDQKGYGSFIATKINEHSLPFFKIFNGGYERYSINFLPVFIGLICIAVAFLLVAWVCIKSFLDLAIMQVILVITASTDLETGERTKAAVEDIFQSAIVIAFQGLELAFYEIVVTWISDGSNGISSNPYLFCVAMIAATVTLFEGSQKVAKFFGVDTGLQNGWQRMVSTAAAGKYLASGAGSIAKGSANAIHKAKTGVQEVGAGVAGFKSGFEDGYDDTPADASSTSATLNGIKQGTKQGLNTARALGSIKEGFTSSGGSNHQFNKALRNGEVQDLSTQMGERMTNANGGLTDNEYNRVHKPAQHHDENGNSNEGAYGDYALKHAQEVSESTHKADPVEPNGDGVAKDSTDVNNASKSVNVEGQTSQTNNTVSENQAKSNVANDSTTAVDQKGRSLDKILGNEHSEVESETIKGDNTEKMVHKESGIDKVKMQTEANTSEFDSTTPMDSISETPENIHQTKTSTNINQPGNEHDVTITKHDNNKIHTESISQNPNEEKGEK
ncbi:pLS20_p028 family conjugation system transmembrane protein [Lactobacillus sp. ESL0681]|uniref:pLS20_p028 family conjugation system transmembrane protein n=1 Tax=Lactobacillus sp. ESL0681 TaxID=2983211 RepID=UPI0023F9DD04|nr:hypothetical protein [Lactobacillus sp. ESL0681]WEV41332.1 hypothetical protein OZX59_09390 [Lactobacillus sp. ESL0681]